MAGQQHPFPSGFPNTQQSTMRNQFGGGQMVSSLMGPQQGGMVNPQQFGPGVGTGVSSNTMGMLSAQQVLAQQQQQQTNALQQMQHLQQQQQQQQQQQMQMQQQQQQVALVQQNSQGGSAATTPQTPVPPTQPPQAQKQPGKDINTASLCRFGQETVQEIVSRTQELFQTLKVLQPPNGTAQGSTIANEKKAKVTEHLRTLNLLFNRLRLIYEKCNESCQSGMEYTHIESLIPLKEEWDMKSDEKKSSEAYRLVYEESKEVMEQVILKNRHLKEIIDHLRRIISEINTMLTMRRS